MSYFFPPQPWYEPDEIIVECASCHEEGPEESAEIDAEGDLVCPPCFEAEREGLDT